MRIDSSVNVARPSQEDVNGALRDSEGGCAVGLPGSYVFTETSRFACLAWPFFQCCPNRIAMGVAATDHPVDWGGRIVAPDERAQFQRL